MSTEQELSELKFKVQGHEHRIAELEKVINDLLKNQTRYPASGEDTPVRPRQITTFEG